MSKSPNREIREAAYAAALRIKPDDQLLLSSAGQDSSIRIRAMAVFIAGKSTSTQELAKNLIASYRNQSTAEWAAILDQLQLASHATSHPQIVGAEHILEKGYICWIQPSVSKQILDYISTARDNDTIRLFVSAVLDCDVDQNSVLKVLLSALQNPTQTPSFRNQVAELIGGRSWPQESRDEIERAISNLSRGNGIDQRCAKLLARAKYN
jgi:hypothetical protein